MRKTLPEASRMHDRAKNSATGEIFSESPAGAEQNAAVAAQAAA
jgi:hypothetical protein